MAIAGYQYRVDGGSPVDVGNVLAATLTGLSSNTSYDFEVRAYDDSGNYSAWSSVLTATTLGPALDPFSTTNARWFALTQQRTDYAGPAARIGGVDKTFAEVLTAAAPGTALIDRIYDQSGSGDYLVPIGGTTPVLKLSALNSEPCWYGGVMGHTTFNDWNGKADVNVVAVSSPVASVTNPLVLGGGGFNLYSGEQTSFGFVSGTAFAEYRSLYERYQLGNIQRLRYDGGGATDADKVKLYYNKQVTTAAASTGTVPATFPANTGIYVGGDSAGTSQKTNEFFGVYYFGYDIDSLWTAFRDSVAAELFVTTKGQLFASGDSLTESYPLNASDPTHVWPEQVVTAMEGYTGDDWERRPNGTIAEVGAVIHRILYLASLNGPKYNDDWCGESVAVVTAGINDLGTEDYFGPATITADASTDIITWTASGFHHGCCVRLSNSGGALPAGLSAGTDYFWIETDADHGKLAATATDAFNNVAVNFTTNGTGTNTIIPTPNGTAVLEKLKLLVQAWWDYGVDRVIVDDMSAATTGADFSAARDVFNAGFMGYSWPAGTELIHFGTDDRIQDPTDATWYVDGIHGTLAFYTAKAEYVTGKILNDVTAPSTVVLSASTGGSGGIDYSFTAATDNVGVARYEYSLDGGAWATLGAATTGTLTAGLTDSTLYSIRVRAVDTSGNAAAASNAVSVTSGVTPAVFSPTDIASLWSWYKADALALSNGTGVASWTDSSGNARHATQATSGQRPTYQTNVLNSKPVVRFAGSAFQYFSLPDMSALTAGEIFIVVKLVAEGTAANGSWLLGADTATSHFPYADGNIYEAFGTTSRKTVGNPTPGLDSWHIYSVWSAAGDWAASLDGTSIFTTATNTVGFQSAPQIGCSGVGGTNPFIDADIAEVVMFSAKLGSPDRASMISYLQAKYAI